MHIIIIAFMLTSAAILLVSENHNPDWCVCGPALVWYKCSEGSLQKGEIWCIVRGNEKISCDVLEVCLKPFISPVFCTAVM
eukprot:4736604-Ditylum_brightwellii.AAC.1